MGHLRSNRGSQGRVGMFWQHITHDPTARDPALDSSGQILARLTTRTPVSCPDSLIASCQTLP